MTTHTMRIESLPKWARDLIDGLTRERDAWKQAAELSRGPESPIAVEHSIHSCLGEPDLYLPKQSRVKFMLGSDRLSQCITLYLSREYPGELHVQGGTPLQVRLHASNTCGLSLLGF